MALEVEVRIAVRFAKPASLVVNRIQSCSVGYHAFCGTDADDRAVLFVERGDQTRFVADVGMVPDPEGGKAADEWPWYAREMREEGAVD